MPALADKGIYIASESTMYRILKNENMQHHRGRSQTPSKSKAPDTHVANGPNQVWTWDIARESHPERWTRDIRNWELPDTVALNPTEEIEDNSKKTG